MKCCACLCSKLPRLCTHAFSPPRLLVSLLVCMYGKNSLAKILSASPRHGAEMTSHSHPELCLLTICVMSSTAEKKPVHISDRPNHLHLVFSPRSPSVQEAAENRTHSKAMPSICDQQRFCCCAHLRGAQGSVPALLSPEQSPGSSPLCWPRAAPSPPSFSRLDI